AWRQNTHRGTIAVFGVKALVLWGVRAGSSVAFACAMIAASSFGRSASAVSFGSEYDQTSQTGEYVEGSSAKRSPWSTSYPCPCAPGVAEVAPARMTLDRG